ncbi:MAG TPA: PSD1 and planctomycete cytochrome C domain-containing protein [Gemmataceae bacterium]|nr:PSD1 and planctomycete cytochrome C domain-containing protein [Gemmataceae bacterium]
MRFGPYCLAFVCVALAAVTARGDVWPILQSKCLACHGEDPKGELKGGLDLRTRIGAIKGGKSDTPAIVPGKPDDSPLYRAVTRKNPDLVMPPKENDKLSVEQVEAIRVWIAAGALWPDKKAAAKVAGVTVKTSGGLSPDWTNRTYDPADLWAYQPVRRPDIPAVRGHFEANNPIDAFIAARLMEKGVDGPADLADKRTLIRRVTFDLTGLPPTPDEVETFLADDSPGAFARVVDRLLRSAEYGEQQARHWLDVTRYADTGGFANDFERPNAWRYRDYVIRSFNVDKPFDRFIVEQLAGDELDPADPEMLIALGFLRSGPWEHTGMTVPAVTRQQWLDDVTNAVGVTFLGHALRCAQCHDHKFDPVPTRDYYRVQAVFAGTFLAERPVPFLAAENVSGFEQGRAMVQERLKRVRELQAALGKKNEEAIAAFLKSKGVKSLEELPAAERPRKDYLGGTYGLTKADLSLRKVHEKSLRYLERELNRFEPFALSAYAGPDNKYTSIKPVNSVPKKGDATVPVVHILTGGSLESPGEAVSPGVFSAIADHTIPTDATGRRLAFARWVASRSNPLTARVIVNRVWQQHFGRGLVATPNNFGKMGAKPTHPELLDWLAAWFIDRGWSVKALHRLIVTSRTYQQASRPRRLAAEELRDAMLAASGELNPQTGGPGVFPEINWEVALQPRHIMGSVAPAYLPSATPRERNRRTVYAFRYRTLGDPLLDVFNRPGSELSCDRRDETTVTPQAFALFNSRFVHSRALALAVDLEKRAADLDGRIRLAFRRLYGRPPTADEAKMCADHAGRMTEHHRTNPPKREDLPRKVRRGQIEELTGELVEWDEELAELQKYERDVMPWDVSPETRGLAEVCLVLLNSNEFLYVR